MSLDLWLEKTPCQMCGHSERTESQNCTYNVLPMWLTIFPDDKRLVDIDGMNGMESIKKLKFSLNALIDPYKFQPLNPSNGWGSYKGLISFITSLLKMANEHPDWVWKSCR